MVRAKNQPRVTGGLSCAVMRSSALIAGALIAAAPTSLPGQRPVPGLQKHDPTAVVSHNVVAQPASYLGRQALRVELAEAYRQRVRKAASAADRALALLPNHLQDGVIEVPLAGELNGSAPHDAPAVVGVAFHVSADYAPYDVVYVRLAGRRGSVAYVSYPVVVGGTQGRTSVRHERTVDVVPGMWYRLRLEIAGASLRVFLDDGKTPLLTVHGLTYAGRSGRVGFAVADGTTGYFGGARLEQ
jgi:hypothetical protein